MCEGQGASNNRPLIQAQRVRGSRCLSLKILISSPDCGGEGVTSDILRCLSINHRVLAVLMPEVLLQLGESHSTFVPEASSRMLQCMRVELENRNPSQL